MKHNRHEEFFSEVSCFFAEGVEFMTSDEIYDAIYKEWEKTIKLMRHDDKIAELNRIRLLKEHL